MPNEQHQVLVNIDLGQSTFVSVSKAYLEKFSGGQTKSSVNWPDFEQMHTAVDDRYELVFFFQRAATDVGPKVSDALEQIASVLESFKNKQLMQSLVKMTLVDCGDSYDVPLSGFDVIGQFVEAVDMAASNEIASSVYAADYPSEDEDTSEIIVRDTAQPEFLDHMAAHIAQSLENINKKRNEKTSLPDFGDPSPTDITGTLDAVLREALDPTKKN